MYFSKVLLNISFVIHLFVLVIDSQTIPQVMSDVSHILKSFSDSGYDKNLRPDYAVKPVNVNVTMYINDISSVSEVQMDYTIDFYLRQIWNDHRLAFNNTNHSVSELHLGGEFTKKIWLPDTFFVNGKHVSLHISTTMESNTLLRIKSNGDILYSIRLTVVASCPMDLKYFPMDSQSCILKIASYGYPTKDIDYHWAQGFDTFGIRGDIYLPTFQIQGLRRGKKFKLLSTGNYTRLTCEFRFTRSMAYYLNQIYIPSFLIVLISWVPFWLDRDDTHARVGLGVTTVLTMTTLITSTNEALPKISYIKAIDVYLFICFLMVFASLLEYATVGYFESSSKGEKQFAINSVLTSNHENQQIISDEKNEKTMRPGLYHIINRHSASKTDKYSRWIFPIVFFIFNLLYWTIYLNLSHETITDLFTAKDF